MRARHESYWKEIISFGKREKVVNRERRVISEGKLESDPIDRERDSSSPFLFGVPLKLMNPTTRLESSLNFRPSLSVPYVCFFCSKT